MTLDSTTFDVAKLERDLETIKATVARHFGISVADLLSKRRHEPLVTQRQIAMHLARELTKGSFPDIARAFGKKDHNTAIHAHGAIPNKALTDPTLNETLARLRTKVAGELLEA